MCRPTNVSRVILFELTSFWYISLSFLDIFLTGQNCFSVKQEHICAMSPPTPAHLGNIDRHYAMPVPLLSFNFSLTPASDLRRHWKKRICSFHDTHWTMVARLIWISVLTLPKTKVPIFSAHLPTLSISILFKGYYVTFSTYECPYGQ